MITLLCAIAIGLIATTSPNAGLVSLYSTPNDLPDLSNTEYFAGETNLTPNEKNNWRGADVYKHSGPNQADLELKNDPNYNDFIYDVTPPIPTETRTQIYHHSP